MVPIAWSDALSGADLSWMLAAALLEWMNYGGIDTSSVRHPSSKNSPGSNHGTCDERSYKPDARESAENLNYRRFRETAHVPGSELSVSC